MRRLGRLIPVLLILITGSLQAAGMDGLITGVTIRPAAKKSQEKPLKEELHFDHGKLTAASFAKAGFPATPYQFAADTSRTFEPMLSWKCTMANVSGETLEWHGIAVGPGPYVKGTLVHTFPKGQKRIYTFRNGW